MKARVTLKDGFRFYKLDNTFDDLKEGDVIETRHYSEARVAERIQSGHLVVEKDVAAPVASVAAAVAQPAASKGTKQGKK